MVTGVLEPVLNLDSKYKGKKLVLKIQPTKT
jgi:hypothetical protein